MSIKHLQPWIRQTPIPSKYNIDNNDIRPRQK